MKLLVLTSETPGNVWLVNQILARFDVVGMVNVVGMVIERRPLALTRGEKYRRRRRMTQRHGVARTLNKLLYNWVRARFRLDSPVAARDHFFPSGAPVAYVREVPSITVEGINDAKCAEFIKRCAPDLLAVCGTGVIRPEVFSLAPKGALNIHTGITPEYRSADPIFWALYRGEPDKVGVTIHFIDRGIDTGPIIHQNAVPVYAEDALGSIYARCMRRGAELYLRALSEVENGSTNTIEREGAENRAYRSIDLGIVQYILFRLRFRQMAKYLPQRDPRPAPQPGEADG